MLVSASSAQCDFCLTTYADFVTSLQRFICIHLLKSYLMDFFPHLSYPFTTHRFLRILAMVERFDNPPMALLILRNG